MPIKVKNIKQLSESECYIYNNTEGILQKVIVFLKENSDKAYTPKEITEGINATNDDNSYSKTVKKNSVNQILFINKKSKRIKTIKSKGIYYWYEKD